MVTIDKTRVPSHIAIIMDGNGRWAKKQGLPRWRGHQEGVEAVRRAIETAGEMGVKYLTLYAFSQENWGRPSDEVKTLMSLMVDAIDAESENLMQNRVRMRTIGNLMDLPENVRDKMNALCRLTENNSGLTVILALSYGSRWEITEAARQLAEKYKSGEIDTITDEAMSAAMTTSGVPDPELLIRTSGECRISNFLLWQIAYTELYFIDKFWPDFGKEDLYLAVQNYQGRERRFGKTGEQVIK